MVIRKSIFILFTLFFFQLAFVSSAAVTGEVVNTPLGMSIIVVSDLSSIVIITPTNNTYLINESLNLTYLASNEESVWYNIDNSINTTITGSVLFNVNEGQHTLYLYANSSYGNITVENVTFYANSSLLNIIYEEYDEMTRGDSTDFRQIAFEDLQNISGVTLENLDFGKMVFNEYINISEDGNASDNILDLDSHIEISNNLISLNSTALPNFNGSATLSLYNLSFTNPRILLDGSVCPLSVCTETDYSGGTLEFNVTHFSSYSAEETPVNSGSPSGGGGGSYTKPVGRLFNVSVERIGVSVKHSEFATKNISITNFGRKSLDFDVKVKGLEDMIIISPDQFSLIPGESKEISLDFIAREDLVAEIYMGKLVFEAGGNIKEVPVFLEIGSKQALFDVDLELLHDRSEISLGEDLVAEIELSNMGETGRIDVEIEYFIKDMDGENVIYGEDTRAVETKLDFIKIFEMPASIELGQYALYVKVKYNGEVASASSWFFVVEEDLKDGDLLFDGIIISIAILILLALIWIIARGEYDRK